MSITLLTAVLLLNVPTQPSSPSSPSSSFASQMAFSKSKPKRDQLVRFAMNDSREFNAVMIADGGAGPIVAVDGVVVSLRNEDIKVAVVLAELAADALAPWQARVDELKAAKPAPRFTIDIPVGDSPVFGAHDAPNTIVAFIDLQAPSSMQVVPFLRAAVDDPRLKGSVRVVIKHRPVVGAGTARDLARLMVAIHTVGGDDAYMKVASGIAAKIAASTNEAVISAAITSKLVDRVALGKALEDAAALDARIDADLELAKRAGATRSPTVFVNGWRLDQLDVDGLLALIEAHPG